MRVVPALSLALIPFPYFLIILHEGTVVHITVHSSWQFNKQSLMTPQFFYHQLLNLHSTLKTVYTKPCYQRKWTLSLAYVHPSYKVTLFKLQALILCNLLLCKYSHTKLAALCFRRPKGKLVQYVQSRTIIMHDNVAILLITVRSSLILCLCISVPSQFLITTAFDVREECWCMCLMIVQGYFKWTHALECSHHQNSVHVWILNHWAQIKAFVWWITYHRKKKPPRVNNDWH